MNSGVWTMIAKDRRWALKKIADVLKVPLDLIA